MTVKVIERQQVEMEAALRMVGLPQPVARQLAGAYLARRELVTLEVKQFALDRVLAYAKAGGCETRPYGWTAMWWPVVIEVQRVVASAVVERVITYRVMMTVEYRDLTTQRADT